VTGLRIVVVDGPGAGAVVDVGAGQLVIGRESGDLRLDDAELSRRHAVIELRGADTWIADAGSTNGTFVNGARVTTPRRLSEGDVIRVGQTDFRVEL
jgi:S-DNA-T family DNA segregation ATPase FtsK/SpoIIIE